MPEPAPPTAEPTSPAGPGANQSGPIPPARRPAWESLTLKGALVMALAYAAGRIGLHLPDGVIASAAEAVVDLLFALGLAAVGVGRARAHTPL